MFKEEIERLEEIMAKTDPTTEAYGMVVFNLRDLLKYAKEKKEWLESLVVEPAKEEAPKPKAKKKAEKTVKNETKEVEKTVQAEAVATETKKAEPLMEAAPQVEYTFEEVRARLSEASTNGIMIQPIISQFVPEGKPVKFSSIPKESYGALMEVLNNAK